MCLHSALFLPFSIFFTYLWLNQATIWLQCSSISTFSNINSIYMHVNVCVYSSLYRRVRLGLLYNVRDTMYVCYMLPWVFAVRCIFFHHRRSSLWSTMMMIKKMMRRQLFGATHKHTFMYIGLFFTTRYTSLASVSLRCQFPNYLIHRSDQFINSCNNQIGGLWNIWYCKNEKNDKVLFQSMCEAII